MIASVSSLKGSSRLSQHSRIVSGHDFPEQSPHLRSRGFTSPARRICGVVCKTRSAPKRLRGVWSLWRPTIRGRHLHWPVADSRAPGVLALRDAASATHTSGYIAGGITAAGVTAAVIVATTAGTTLGLAAWALPLIVLTEYSAMFGGAIVWMKKRNRIAHRALAAE